MENEYENFLQIKCIIWYFLVLFGIISYYSTLRVTVYSSCEIVHKYPISSNKLDPTLLWDIGPHNLLNVFAYLLHRK